MKETTLYCCPQLQGEIKLACESLGRGDVRVEALRGHPDDSGCRLPNDPSFFNHARAAICGPCASSDPAVRALIPPSLSVSCCEELLSERRAIESFLSSGAHFILPKSGANADIPWQRWGFKTRDSAIQYLEDSVTQIVRIVDKDNPPDLSQTKHFGSVPQAIVLADYGKIRSIVANTISYAELTRDLKEWRARANESQMFLDLMAPLFDSKSVEAAVPKLETLLNNTLGGNFTIDLEVSNEEVVSAGLPTDGLIILPLESDGEQIGVVRGNQFASVQHKSHYLRLLRNFAPLITSAIKFSRDNTSYIENLRLNRTVIEALEEGLVITDTNGIVLSVNRAFERITGYGAEDIVAKKISLLKSGNHDSTFYKALWESLISLGKWSGEVTNRRKDGSIYVQRLNITAVKNSANETVRYAGLLADVTQEREAQNRLEKQVSHDMLTGLVNREGLMSQLERMLSDRRKRPSFAVFFIDLDRFKWVNDSYGHGVGDSLLIEVASRLQRRFRGGDCIARVGGDEFVALVDSISEPDEALSIARSVLDAIDAPFKLGSITTNIGACIGISLCPTHGEDAEKLIGAADDAMYQAKESGRNGIEFWSDKRSTDRSDQIFTHNSIIEAIRENKFTVSFQPIVRLSDGRPIGAEALIRLSSEDGKPIPPDSFMPAVERHGLSDIVGAMVAEQSISAATRWPAIDEKPLYLSLNVTAGQLHHGSFDAEQLQLWCDKYDFSLQRIVAEVIERTVIDPEAPARKSLDTLQERGVRIALDDFGTGYSAFSYLTEINADIIKIDRGFIDPLPNGETAIGIAEALIGVCHSLKTTVIAEGVETEAQAEFLRERGVQFAQGFLFAKPMPVVDFEQWLIEKSH